MAQRADKWQEWSERLGRFARGSGVTVAAFCRAERISEPSFYQWRRKLDVRGTKGAIHKRRSTGESPQTFVPVQLVPTAGTAAIVEIQLPNGARISLPSDDRQLLMTAIAAAGQVPGAGDKRPALHEGAAAC